jgi:hypothetical protein
MKVQLDLCGGIGGRESPALIKSIGVENQEVYEKVIDFFIDLPYRNNEKTHYLVKGDGPN